MDSAVDAVLGRGLDQSLPHRYHPPRQPVTPAVLVASALLLTALMLGITAISSHARTASLRRQFGRMIAIGANQRVVRRVQIVTQAAITTLAVAGACTVTGLTVGAMLLRLTGTQVNPPWALLCALIGSLVVAQILAALVALRALRPELAREA